MISWKLIFSLGKEDYSLSLSPEEKLVVFNYVHVQLIAMTGVQLLKISRSFNFPLRKGGSFIRTL